MRLVLDTNVWLDLLLFNDPRCAAIRLALQSGRALALTNAACRNEWLRVLAYPTLRLEVAHAQSLRQRFDRLAVSADRAVRPQPWPQLPRCRDPDDQKFLELACTSKADWLLSRDRELLRLARRMHRVGLFGIGRPEALCIAEPHPGKQLIAGIDRAHVVAARHCQP